MVLNVLNIIVLVTVVVSILAFTNNEISRKLLYIPYEVKNGNKLKVYHNIISESDNIKKNWKLMHLDTAMLSADQVKKINHQIENKEEKLNKLDLMRIMNREGLNNFDVHTFLLTLKSYLRGN